MAVLVNFKICDNAKECGGITVCPTGALSYDDEIPGMWNMERYISLLLGEIPRLSDNEAGYGPKGKDFIAHVDIPEEVRNAFDELCKEYAGAVRKANPLYAGGHKQ